MRIVEFISGPYSEGGFVWMICRMTDGRGAYWEEEIYYDTYEDAYDDMLEHDIDIEDEYLTEEEEEQLDGF
jgi:hypothetical protein